MYYAQVAQWRNTVAGVSFSSTADYTQDRNNDWLVELSKEIPVNLTHLHNEMGNNGDQKTLCA